MFQENALIPNPARVLIVRVIARSRIILRATHRRAPTCWEKAIRIVHVQRDTTTSHTCAATRVRRGPTPPPTTERNARCARQGNVLTRTSLRPAASIAQPGFLARARWPIVRRARKANTLQISSPRRACRAHQENAQTSFTNVRQGAMFARQDSLARLKKRLALDAHMELLRASKDQKNVQFVRREGMQTRIYPRQNVSNVRLDSSAKLHRTEQAQRAAMPVMRG